MEEEKNGISLGDIFRTIFSQKWLALILAVVITLVCAVGIVYIYNPMKRSYSVSFELDLPGNDNGVETYYYPDGTAFHYLSLVSSDTLLKIKENGGEDFADVDVEGMVKKGAISIKEETEDISGAIDRTYILTVKASYLGNSDVARKFMTAIAEYPLKYLAGINIEYNSALKFYEASDDYSRQIDYLKTQLWFLQQKYNSLISEYGNEFVVENGRTLKTYLEEITAYGESAEFINLKTELKEGKYVKSQACLDSYKLEAVQVKNDLEDAEYVLGEMKAVQSDALGSAEAVRNQAEKVASLKRKQQELTIFTDGTAVIDTEGVFAQKLATVAGKLTVLTDTVKSVTEKVYKNASSVFYSDSNVVNTEGGIGTTTAIILSLIVGVLVAAIAAYIVGYNKNKKALTATETVNGEGVQAPAEEQVVAEAAPAEEKEK